MHALDAYVDGLCVDVRDGVQRFVVEATLQVERSWANWDLVAAARSHLFVHWLNVRVRVLSDKKPPSPLPTVSNVPSLPYVAGVHPRNIFSAKGRSKEPRIPMEIRADALKAWKT